jgi:NAD(P)-dependent dehydrogenase (short-subunit alcohol dehydrogenase family)
MSLFDLSGKVAIVTGSSRGIGKAIAVHMARQGARVVISSRKAESCEAVVAEIVAAGGTAMAHAAHVGHKQELEALVDTTISRWGRIDVLVCNAATNPHFGPSISITDAALEKVIQTNLYSNIWLCNLTLPRMAERKDGAVIIISSVAGFYGTQLLGAYAISKAADMQLARNLACEYGKHNVRVNCIAPGLIKTDFAKALWDNPENLKASTARSPLLRIGIPDEIAGAAVFMGSKAGDFMTGQTMVIDGGATIS